MQLHLLCPLISHHIWVLKANVSDDDATQLEIYNLLLNQLENEEKIKKQFEKIMDDCNQIIDQRKYETDNPKLTFRIFDKLRNGAIRELRLKEVQIHFLIFSTNSSILSITNRFSYHIFMSLNAPSECQVYSITKVVQQNFIKYFSNLSFD